jgi:iron complex outermembrane receptor protein
MKRRSIVELLSSLNANGSPNTGFLNLDAQRAWQLELGHRGTSADKRYSWDVTVYNLEMQKEILASNINNQGTFQNANGTRHTGVEAGGGMVLKKGLFAQGGAGKEDSLQTRVAYTWSRFKFTDDVRGGGDRRPECADRQGRQYGGRRAGAQLERGTRYDHPAGLVDRAECRVVAVRASMYNYHNTIKNPSYALINRAFRLEHR